MPKKLKQLVGTLDKSRKGRVVMVELPADTYFQSGSSIVSSLLKKGHAGVYISFQRPFANLHALFSQKGVDTRNLYIIDVAAAFAKEKPADNKKCIHVSQKLDIDELVKATYTSLGQLASKKSFIFIDSLSTIALYKPLSETLRFSEFLMSRVRKGERMTSVIFNIATDLAQRKFIQDIALQVDEVVRL